MGKGYPNPGFITISGLQEVFDILSVCEDMERRTGKCVYYGFNKELEGGYHTVAKNYRKDFPLLRMPDATADFPMLPAYRRLIGTGSKPLRLVANNDAVSID